MPTVQSYIKKISETKEKLNQHLIDEISKINVDTGAKRINNLCSTVSFSTISKNNYILSASYYNIQTQKDAVIEKVRKSKDSGIGYIESIIESGYDSTKSLKFHPEFLKQLKIIIEK